MSDKKPVGGPPKSDGDKKTTFSVNCMKKNVEIIKPMVKEWVKDLDKKDWSKEAKQ
jgi:hypothetical protein